MIASALFAAATATTSTILFACCDCNPTLFVFDRWLQLNYKLRTQETNAFSNQRIWIIGASSGIGEELAYQLVSSDKHTTEKAIVHQNPSHCNHPIHLILSSRSADKLEKVASTCRSSNINCTVTVLPLDVSNDNDLLYAVRHIKTNFEPVDTVVFNAGIGHLTPAAETPTTTIDSVWKQTARWPMVLVPLLFQYNIFQNNHKKRPHIVVTSSIAALVPVPLSATYVAAKSALQGYFRSLQSENPNILLHTVMPGPVDTDFHRQNRFNSTVHDNALLSTNNSTAHQPSPLKMSVQRCVQLLKCTMKLPYSTESWIAQQPLLFALYVQKVLPFGLLQSLIYSRVGTKRIRLWRNGLDLYDPASWRK